MNLPRNRRAAAPRRSARGIHALLIVRLSPALHAHARARPPAHGFLRRRGCGRWRSMSTLLHVCAPGAERRLLAELAAVYPASAHRLAGPGLAWTELSPAESRVV